MTRAQIIGLLVISAFAGCTCTRNHEKRLAPPATAPFHEAVLKGQIKTETIPLPGPCWVPDAELELSLTVDGVLAMHDGDDTDSHEPEAQQMIAGNWKLSAAKDGHAFAYSLDDGATWHAAYLDVVSAGTLHPFACRHRKIEVPPGVEPGDAIPATRATVLEVLRNLPRPPSGGGDPGSTEHCPEDGIELRGAFLFAAQHADDEEVAQALVQDVLPTLDEGYWGWEELSGVQDAVTLSLQAAATRFPSVRETLEETYLQVDKANRLGRSHEKSLRLIKQLLGPEDVPKGPRFQALFVDDKNTPLSGRVEVWLDRNPPIHFATGTVDAGEFGMDLPNDEYLLVPIIDGFDPTELRIRSPDHDASFRLGRGTSLEVTVRLQGKPVEGARISARARSHDGYLSPIRQGVTNPKGTVRLENLPEREQWVEIEAPGRACTLLTSTAVPLDARGDRLTDQEVHAELSSRPPIKGHLVDSTKRPVAGAVLRFVPSDTAPADACNTREVTTDAHGQFSLLLLPTPTPTYDITLLSGHGRGATWRQFPEDGFELVTPQ